MNERPNVKNRAVFVKNMLSKFDFFHVWAAQ